MITDDQELVRRMIAGDESAFEEFCHDYPPALLRFTLRRLAGDRELARDVVQATVGKAIAKLASFRGEAALMTWLCAVCRNEIAAHYRRAMRAGTEVELQAVEETMGVAQGAGGAEDPEGAALREEASQLVHVVLDSLAPRHAQALEWKYLDDLPVRDIARRLNVGEKAAESLLTRARQSFRDGYARLVNTVPSAAENVRLFARRMEFEP